MTGQIFQQIRLRSIFFFVLCLFLFTGCIGSKRVNTIVYDDKNRSVRLEARLGKDKKPIEYGYQHPAALSQQDLQKLISSIYIKRSKSLLGLLIPALGAKDPEQAFTPDEVQFLSQYLSRAFSEANPDQRATFILWRSRGSQIREVTSGAAFVRDDRLNIVLANDRTIIDREKMSVADEDDPLYVYEQDAFKILPRKHQELVKADPKMSDLEEEFPKTWIAIDYQKILASQPPAEPLASPAEPKPASPQEATSPSLQTSPPPVAEPVPASPFEEKLRLLKRLREQGLITEEEYQAKRGELLKSF